MLTETAEKEAAQKPQGAPSPVVAPAPEAVPTIIEKHPVAEALRTEILKLANEGDSKHKGALTGEVLMRIMRVAKTGHDLLVSLNINGAGLAGLVRRPRMGGIYSPLGGQEFADDGLGDSQSAGPFAFSPPAENFGMTAIREIVAAAKNFGGGNASSPAKLVEALAIAREKNMPDVAKELEAQLGLIKSTPVAVPVPADKKGA